MAKTTNERRWTMRVPNPDTDGPWTVYAVTPERVVIFRTLGTRGDAWEMLTAGRRENELGEF